MFDDLDIYQDLRQRLTSGEFAHGAKLRADTLRDGYKCSASKVREVLLRLSAEGLVELQDQRGFRVPELSKRLQHELTLMRIMLEAEGTRLSIQNGGVDWEARLAAAHHKLLHIEMRISSSSNARIHFDLWLKAEQEFHETLISACDSDVLKRLHKVIYAQFRQQLVTSDRNFGFGPDNIAQHQAIFDAAIEADPRKVHERLHDHLMRNLMHPVQVDTETRTPIFI